MLARIIQGLATGAAMGAVGAGMIDLNKERGATANAVAPPFGTATGSMLSGYLVQYLPAPTHLVYAVLCVVFVLQGICIASMADTIAPAPGALASLKPRLNLPAAVRGPFVLALPVLIAGWALAGFYGSLGPMLVRGMLGVGSPLLGGVALFVLTASAGLAVLVLQHREPRAMMTFGASLLAAGGVGIAVWSLPHHAIAWCFSSVRPLRAWGSAPASKVLYAALCVSPRLTSGPGCYRSCSSFAICPWACRRSPPERSWLGMETSLAPARNSAAWSLRSRWPQLWPRVCVWR